MSFAEPDEWHAPATYWFWHRIPTDEEIRSQLDTMADAGFRSFQIQTRLSFPLADYLGPEYLAACRLAADEAERRGLMIGIYDDYNWLSGHAGGRSVEGHGHLRERHLFWSTAAAGADNVVDGIRAKDVDYLMEPGRNWVFEGGEPRWDEWVVVAAFAHPLAGIDSVESIVDVMEHAVLVDAGEKGCRVRVPASAGLDGVTVFVAARCASSRMINYLLPEAAQRFLDVGYEPYAKAFGEHLGSTVKYVFFDQPHGCFFDWDQRAGHVGSSVMYAPAVLPPDRRVLMALPHDVGPLTAAWRCDFFQRYSDLGIDSFFGTLSDWCQEHDVALSGHEVLGYVSSWDPASTIITEDPRTNFGTDYFGLDRWRDLTAVDARNDHPQVAAKFGDSVARSNGRSGCLVEQYFARTVAGSHFAAGRWELTLGALRTQTVRHHLLGARQLLMHAFWLTDGTDDDELFTNPRFDFAPGVNFEPWFAHHRAFAEESGRLSEFLEVGEPLGEIALFYPLRTSWAHGPEHPYGPHTAFWAELLARRGYDYHLVDERDLRSGRVAQRYRTLILPGAAVVEDKATIDALAAFVRGGGTLLASGPVPEASQETGATAGMSARVLGLARRHWPELPDPVAASEALRGAVAGHAHIDSEGSLWSRRIRDDASTRVAVFNDEQQSVVIDIRPSSLPAQVTRWRPESGLVEEPFELAGALRLTLSPGELACFSLADGVTAVPPAVTLDSGWTLRTGDVERLIDVGMGWERQGLPEFSGIGTYRVAFDLTEADLAWPSWELVLPAAHTSAEAEINGRLVGVWGWGPFRCEVDVAVLRAAGNELRVKVASTAANQYYAGTRHQDGGPEPSGLTAAPMLRPAL
jgi:hypothetical protein